MVNSNFHVLPQVLNKLDIWVLTEILGFEPFQCSFVRRPKSFAFQLFIYCRIFLYLALSTLPSTLITFPSLC